MTNFLVLNFQDFDLNQDVTEAIKTFNPFCICCLDKSSPLIHLSGCVHARFLQSLSLQIETSTQMVCQQCHATLVKISQFQRQVEDCHTYLKDHTNYAETSHDNPIKYSKLTSLSPYSLKNIDIVNYELIEPKKEIVAEQIVSEPIVTIHEEEDRQSDNEVVEIPKKKKLKKGLKSKLKKEKDEEEPTEKTENFKETLFKRFSGRIRRVTLSHSELLEEREREASSEAYRNLPFKCTDCIVAFDHEINYKGHMERRHNSANGNDVCDICKSVLGSTKSMRKHMKNHYNRYECVTCGKRYITRYSSAQHASDAHGELPQQYRCKLCQYVTNTISAYAYHRNKHRSNPECPECGKQCSSTANLKTHLFAVHKKSSRLYSCPYCNKPYNTKSGLDYHTKTQHGTKENRDDAYCRLCRLQFNSIRCYKAHLRQNSKHVSNDAKKFVCPSCGARFVTNASMKRHVDWVHLKVFKYQCPDCVESFRTRPHLDKHHKLVHEKILPPRNKICQYCGKGFMTIQVLRAHIRTHTGERPLQCTFCTATFAHNAALYTHKKLIHKCAKREKPTQ